MWLGIGFILISFVGISVLIELYNRIQSLYIGVTISIFLDAIGFYGYWIHKDIYYKLTAENLQNLAKWSSESEEVKKTLLEQKSQPVNLPGKNT
ncbi:hypothetical protein AB4090_13915 [Acidithiobacillus sp. IBUN Pt1247-S3]